MAKKSARKAAAKLPTIHSARRVAADLVIENDDDNQALDFHVAIQTLEDISQLAESMINDGTAKNKPPERERYLRRIIADSTYVQQAMQRGYIGEAVHVAIDLASSWYHIRAVERPLRGLSLMRGPYVAYGGSKQTKESMERDWCSDYEKLIKERPELNGRFKKCAPIVAERTKFVRADNGKEFKPGVVENALKQRFVNRNGD